MNTRPVFCKRIGCWVTAQAGKKPTCEKCEPLPEQRYDVTPFGLIPVDPKRGLPYFEIVFA